MLTKKITFISQLTIVLPQSEKSFSLVYFLNMFKWAFLVTQTSNFIAKKSAALVTLDDSVFLSVSKAIANFVQHYKLFTLWGKQFSDYLSVME